MEATEEGGANPHSARLLFANISEWGPKAQSFMRGAGTTFETVAFAETHVKISGVEAARAELLKDEWKMVGTPASASASSSSGSRG
eukprot:6636722-Pyramimonas_sp.AAC.1